MTTDQFIEWFHNDFVPYIRKELESLEEPNAVLVLDNCSAHPDSDEHRQQNLREILAT